MTSGDETIVVEFPFADGITRKVTQKEWWQHLDENPEYAKEWVDSIPFHYQKTHYSMIRHMDDLIARGIMEDPAKWLERHEKSKVKK